MTTEKMTDREMLELAAKAAGIDLAPTGFVWSDAASEMVPWNPLTDDGDALRLAVSLRISINHGKPVDVTAQWEGVMASRGPIQGSNPRVHAEEVHGAVVGAEPHASTRRAIVRAAAEIGKAMP